MLNWTLANDYNSLTTNSEYKLFLASYASTVTNLDTGLSTLTIDFGAYVNNKGDATVSDLIWETDTTVTIAFASTPTEPFYADTIRLSNISGNIPIASYNNMSIPTGAAKLGSLSTEIQYKADGTIEDIIVTIAPGKFGLTYTQRKIDDSGAPYFETRTGTNMSIFSDSEQVALYKLVRHSDFEIRDASTDYMLGDLMQFRVTPRLTIRPIYQRLEAEIDGKKITIDSDDVIDQVIDTSFDKLESEAAYKDYYFSIPVEWYKHFPEGITKVNAKFRLYSYLGVPGNENEQLLGYDEQSCTLRTDSAVEIYVTSVKDNQEFSTSYGLFRDNFFRGANNIDITLYVSPTSKVEIRKVTARYDLTTVVDITHTHNETAKTYTLNMFNVTSPNVELFVQYYHAGETLTHRVPVTLPLRSYSLPSIYAEISNPMNGYGDISIAIRGTFWNGAFVTTSGNTVLNEITVTYKTKKTDTAVVQSGTVSDLYVEDGAFDDVLYLSEYDYKAVSTYIYFEAVDALGNKAVYNLSLVATPIFDWSKEDFNFNIPAVFQKGQKFRADQAITGIQNDSKGKPSGEEVPIFVPLTSTGDTVLGYSHYENFGGRTLVCGNGVDILTTDGFTINGREYNKPVVLWEGAEQMGEDSVITLSESSLNMPRGIQLIFSLYRDGAAADASIQSFFLSTYELYTFYGGHTFTLNINSGFSKIGAKYLYIYGNEITGNATNTASGQSNGITFDNRSFVLRKVIGW